MIRQTPLGSFHAGFCFMQQPLLCTRDCQKCSARTRTHTHARTQSRDSRINAVSRTCTAAQHMLVLYGIGMYFTSIVEVHPKMHRNKGATHNHMKPFRGNGERTCATSCMSSMLMPRDEAARSRKEAYAKSVARSNRSDSSSVKGRDSLPCSAYLRSGSWIQQQQMVGL